MIADLQGEFEDELNQTNKQEENDQNSYLMEKQASESEKASADKLTKQKIGEIAQLEGEKASYDSDVQTHSKSLKAAKDYSKRLGQECAVKAQDYIRESKSRADELQAIDEATEILSGAAVNTAGKVTSPPSDAHPGDEAFLQIPTAEAGKRKIVAFLRSKGQKLNSRTLMQLAEMASADPFGKVGG